MENPDRTIVRLQVPLDSIPAWQAWIEDRPVKVWQVLFSINTLLQDLRFAASETISACSLAMLIWVIVTFKSGMNLRGADYHKPSVARLTKVHSDGYEIRLLLNIQNRSRCDLCYFKLGAHFL